LGTVLGVATQNPTFSGFDTQKNTQFWVFIPNTMPNTQKLWVYNCVNYLKYYPYTHTIAPKIFEYWEFFWVSKPENFGFWVATTNTVPKPKNFWMQFYRMNRKKGIL
jgi:hypothetical protein